MKILRKKHIFVPDGSVSWAETHAMNPTVDILNDKIIRVYYSALDSNKVGRIGYADLNIDNLEQIISISETPVLDVGNAGTFDDNGVVPSAIVTVNNTKYLYYYGFQIVQKVRFLLFTGLAISTDGGNSFIRHSQTPILERNDLDLYIRSLPFVMIDNGIWKMWYSGVSEWTDVHGKKLPLGNIRYVESKNGFDYNNQSTKTCLIPNTEEFSLSRAYVFKHDNLYKMLFSCRFRDDDSYKLGYAESVNGWDWKRNDDRLNISPSNSDWDNQMMCYASIVNLKDKYYLFYNGNNFGATGFGYAEVKF